ncbi:hypothetical protein [Bacillus sp. YKCMOAS1]|nr:hypothetical protein [Bacillus sp. YKCMOAS1]GLJ03690.1 hypothetical protein OAS1_29390 [Bacillus sp. YKCMOAS1]
MGFWEEEHKKKNIILGDDGPALIEYDIYSEADSFYNPYGVVVFNK